MLEHWLQSSILWDFARAGTCLRFDLSSLEFAYPLKHGYAVDLTHA